MRYVCWILHADPARAIRDEKLVNRSTRYGQDIV